MMKKILKTRGLDVFLSVAFILILVTPQLRLTVMSNLQRALLFTGIFNADLREETVEEKLNYSFVLSDTSNYKINTELLKGKVLFINVWATWCPPCMAEMPGITQLYQEVGDEIEFIMISVDSDTDKAKKWINNNNFPVPVYFPKKWTPSLEYKAIPSTWVISKKGEIVYQHSGMAQYNNPGFKDFLLSL